jgi:uncharacterized protein YoxC
MIIEISVAVIALAFVALVIYLILTLSALRVTLTQVNQTLSHGRRHLDTISEEAKKVMEHTNRISVNVQHKVEAFNSLFNAFANLGEVFEKKTSHFKERMDESTSSHFTHHPTVEKVGTALELVGQGIRLWQKLKQRR